MKNKSGLSNIGIWGSSRYLSRKTIRSVQENNRINQGVVYYEPSEIEAFFDNNEAVGGMLFSGGYKTIRNRAIIRTIECAYMQGYSVAIIHNGNAELENELISYLTPLNLLDLVNAKNPFYEPFLGLNNNEILQYILSSSSKEYKIGATGRYYINGISDFINTKHIHPYTDMYITCPHFTLIDKINTAEAKGKISANEARTITSQILQGESEKGNIEAFFSALSQQADYILAKKKNLNKATNFVQTALQKAIFSIDVRYASNTLLINLFVSEAELLLSRGNKVFVIVDGELFTTNNLLKDFINKMGSSSLVAISSNDAFSAFNGDENSFYSFAGKCAKIIISRHISAYSCEKISNLIGTYDKQEIVPTFSQNTNMGTFWSYGNTKSASINTKRESIIKPEEIQRMADDEVIVFDKNNNEISFVPII